MGEWLTFNLIPGRNQLQSFIAQLKRFGSSCRDGEKCGAARKDRKKSYQSKLESASLSHRVPISSFAHRAMRRSRQLPQLCLPGPETARPR